MQTHIKPMGEYNPKILQAINDERIAKGISIRQLAHNLGVYPNSVQQWLNPNTNIQMDNLVMLGNALGITFSLSNTRRQDNTAYQLIDLLRKAKSYQELTTRDLAELTGITQPSIVGIFSHKIMPRLNAFLLLAQALGLEFELWVEE